MSSRHSKSASQLHQPSTSTSIQTSLQSSHRQYDSMNQQMTEATVSPEFQQSCSCALDTLSQAATTTLAELERKSATANNDYGGPTKFSSTKNTSKKPLISSTRNSAGILNNSDAETEQQLLTATLHRYQQQTSQQAAQALNSFDASKSQAITGDHAEGETSTINQKIATSSQHRNSKQNRKEYQKEQCNSGTSQNNKEGVSNQIHVYQKLHQNASTRPPCSHFVSTKPTRTCNLSKKVGNKSEQRSEHHRSQLQNTISKPNTVSEDGSSSSSSINSQNASHSSSTSFEEKRKTPLTNAAKRKFSAPAETNTNRCTGDTNHEPCPNDASKKRKKDERSNTALASSAPSTFNNNSSSFCSSSSGSEEETVGSKRNRTTKVTFDESVQTRNKSNQTLMNPPSSPSPAKCALPPVSPLPTSATTGITCPSTEHPHLHDRQPSNISVHSQGTNSTLSSLTNSTASSLTPAAAAHASAADKQQKRQQQFLSMMVNPSSSSSSKASGGTPSSAAAKKLSNTPHSLPPPVIQPVVAGIGSIGNANNIPNDTANAKMDAVEQQGNINNNMNFADNLQWTVMFERLCKYALEYGNCLVPLHYSKDPALGSWVAQQRQNSESLSMAQREKLVMAGFTFLHEWNWNVFFERLCKYALEYGDCNVPANYEKDMELALWVIHQRYNTNSLEPNQRQKLDMAGFVFLDEWKWNVMFERLCKYAVTHNNCLVPAVYKDDQDLADWVVQQRFAEYTMPAKQKEKLEMAGFLFNENWDYSNNTKANSSAAAKAAWEAMFQRLVNYKRKNGTCQVPTRYSDDPQLGRWVDKQRVRELLLSSERKQRLTNIGFVWSVYQTTWEKMLEALRLYKKQHGHCRVPRKYEANQQLGKWVDNQRYMLRQKRLTPERLAQLQSLGFE